MSTSGSAVIQKNNTVENEVDSSELVGKKIVVKHSERVSIHDVEPLIKNEQYHVFEPTACTVCCLELVNGFTVIGKSACIFETDFDAELGRKFAKEDALKKILELEAYLLMSTLV